jgi:hypothetical protein
MENDTKDRIKLVVNLSIAFISLIVVFLVFLFLQYMKIIHDINGYWIGCILSVLIFTGVGLIFEVLVLRKYIKRWES